MKLIRAIAPALFLSALPARALELDLITARAPLALLLVRPNEQTRTSNLELARLISERLATDTDFAVIELDPRAEQTIACRGELECIASTARRDVVTAEGARPSYVLIITNVGQGETEPDRVSAELVSTIDSKVLARSTDNVRDLAQVKSWFELFVERELRALFERDGHWRPYGSIVLRGVDRANVQIAFDGRAAGLTNAGENLLDRAPPGEHELELSGPEIEIWKGRATVKRGERTEVDVELRARAWMGAPRIAATALGAASFAAGIVLAGVAIANAGDTQHCLAIAEAASCGSETRAVRFGGSSSSDVAGPFAPERGGAPIAPIAIGFVGMGAAWSLGSIFMNERDEIPWIPLLAGVAIFGATYGIGAAVSE